MKCKKFSFSLHGMAIRFFTIERRYYHYHCIALLLANFDAREKERPFSLTLQPGAHHACPF